MTFAPALRRCVRPLPLALALPLLLPALAAPAQATGQSPAPAELESPLQAILPDQPAAAPVQPAPLAPVAPVRRLAFLPASPATGLNLPFAITPERRALLNTIRFAEGTWAEGREIGYRVMFGGGLMPSLDRHPNRVIRTSGYASAAAGAYQFMPFTWSMASQALGLNGFGPEVQDQAALYLIQRRGALDLADRGQLTPQLVARLAPEWASFPTLRGGSYYGQPVKRFASLRRFYEQSLQALRSSFQAPSESPADGPADAPAPVLTQPAAPTTAELPGLCNDSSLDCQIERLQKLRPAPGPILAQPGAS